MSDDHMTTLGEALSQLPSRPASGPIQPVTDEEIASWLCSGGGIDCDRGSRGGCEDWPDCLWCRTVARIDADREKVAMLRSNLINLVGLARMRGSLTEYAAALADADAAIAKASGGGE